MILVFLHGKGSDHSAYEKQLKKLARNLSVGYVSFDAPLNYESSSNRFTWFNKIEKNGCKIAVKEDHEFSLVYIKERLEQLGYQLSDVVLIGHSQGGGMAVCAGLKLGLKAVFSICGDLPYNIKYMSKSKTPIYWFEGANDTYISQERKESYKILKEIKANLHYKVIDECSHNQIDSAFCEIEKILS